MSHVTATDPLVQRLVSDFAGLSLEVQRLRERVSELESQVGGNSARSSGSFFLVEPPNVSGPPESSQRPAGYCVGTEREQIAREIGLWLRRALDGRPRGPSGRDRIQLASRYYLVCRDIQGKVRNPPLLFSGRLLRKLAAVTENLETPSSLGCHRKLRLRSPCRVRRLSCLLPCGSNDFFE